MGSTSVSRWRRNVTDGGNWTLLSPNLCSGLIAPRVWTLAIRFHTVGSSSTRRRRRHPSAEDPPSEQVPLSRGPILPVRQWESRTPTGSARPLQTDLDGPPTLARRQATRHDPTPLEGPRRRPCSEPIPRYRVVQVGSTPTLTHIHEQAKGAMLHYRRAPATQCELAEKENSKNNNNDKGAVDRPLFIPSPSPGYRMGQLLGCCGLVERTVAATP